ncbi:SH3 domain-containing protein [Breznakiellaceae bacterium SP9]
MGIRQSSVLCAVFLAGVFAFQVSALELTNTVTFKGIDDFATYLNSATPGQILEDVGIFLPAAHKNRVIAYTEQVKEPYDKKAEDIQALTFEHFNRDGFYEAPPYSLRAYIWFDTNDEGYVFLINNGVLFDARIIHYVLGARPNPNNAVQPKEAVRQFDTNSFHATHRVLTNDGSNLRLRNEPNGTQIGSLANGSYVQVLETGYQLYIDNDGYRGNWMFVRLPTGKTGWCFGAYLKSL